MSTSVGYATLQIIPSARGFRSSIETQIAPDMAGAGAAGGKAYGDSFASQFKSMIGPLAASFSAIAAAGFIKSSVDAAVAAQAGQSRLANLLKVTNGASADQVAILNEQAKALERIGVVSSDKITTVQSQLATFDLSIGAIQKLTPAILDYVTSEKGANASTDEFKSLTNGLAQALNGNFASLTAVGFVLDDATRKQIKYGTESERSQAIVDVLNSTYKDFNKNLRDTPQGRLIILSNEFKKFKEGLGSALLPVVEAISSALTELLGVIKIIPGPIKVFIGVFTALATTLLLGKKAIAAVKVGLKLLKAEIMANPVGLLIVAVVALATALVYAYKKSETFRKIINDVFRAIAPVVGTVVGYVIGALSSLVKYFTLSIRTVLLVLSKLPKVGPIAQKALDGLDAFTGKLDDLAKSSKDALVNWSKGLTDTIDKSGKETAKAAGKAGEGTGNAFVDGAAKKKFQTALKGALGASFIKAIQGSKEGINNLLTSLGELVATSGNKKAIALVASFKKKLIALVDQRDVLREQYSAAKSNLESLQKEAADYLKSVKNAVVETGNIASSRSFSSLIRNLTGAVTKAKAFAQVVADLKNSGLNNTSLKQLVDAGPAAGLKAAKALLASGAAGINTVNELQSQLETQGESIGKTISGTIYDAAIADAQKTVDTIGAQLTTIEDQIVSVAASFAKELAKISQITPPAWLSDLLGVTQYTVTPTAGAFVSPKTATTSTTASKTATTKTVTVNNYNPVAEPSSITTQRILTRLALVGD